MLPSIMCAVWRMERKASSTVGSQGIQESGSGHKGIEQLSPSSFASLRSRLVVVHTQLSILKASHLNPNRHTNPVLFSPDVATHGNWVFGKYYVTHIFPGLKIPKRECHALKAQQEHILYERCFTRYYTGQMMRAEGGVMYARQQEGTANDLRRLSPDEVWRSTMCWTVTEPDEQIEAIEGGVYAEGSGAERGSVFVEASVLPSIRP
ncbi:hypothetical protein H4582DRAFT_2131067 [Lactarius indigo]|nr:hypothetical protein H4582DRAFT_2131067 [Lactarius indigo]